jgi:hypothetical protein
MFMLMSLLHVPSASPLCFPYNMYMLHVTAACLSCSSELYVPAAGPCQCCKSALQAMSLLHVHGMLHVFEMETKNSVKKTLEAK